MVTNGPEHRVFAVVAVLLFGGVALGGCLGGPTDGGAQQKGCVKEGGTGGNTSSAGLATTTASYQGASAFAKSPEGTGLQAESGPQLKLGTILPITGDLSPFGPSAQKAVDLAVKKVNNNGGVNGMNVTVVHEDSQTSQSAAPQAASKLLNEDEIDALVGAMGSGISLSIIDQVTQARVPMISPSNTAPTFTTYEDNGYYFRTVASDAFQGQVMAQLLTQDGCDSAAIIAINNDYGTGLGDVFKREFQERGGTVTNYVKYDPQGTTFESDVQKALQGNPDAVVLVGYPDTGSTMATTAYQQGGFQGTDWYFSEGLKDQKFVTQTGNTTAGTPILAGTKGTTPQFSLGKEFKQDFRQEYGKDPALFSDNTYDAAVLHMLAAEKCDCATGPGLKAALPKVQNPPGQQVGDIQQALTLVRAQQDIDWDGAAGDLDWDQHGDVTRGVYAVWKITETGNITTVQEDIVVQKGNSSSSS